MYNQSQSYVEAPFISNISNFSKLSSSHWVENAITKAKILRGVYWKTNRFYFSITVTGREKSTIRCFQTEGERVQVRVLWSKDSPNSQKEYTELYNL